jgi:hypothetical protein
MTYTVVDNEWKLLIACARDHMGLGTGEVKKAAAANIDWWRVIDLAKTHGLLAILYRAARKSILESVPEQVMKDLRFKYLDNSQKNYVLSEELINILGLLESENIMALTFKGSVLSEFLYGSLSDRYFSDIDLLVHKNDAIRARILLETLGYRPDRRLNREQEEAFLSSKHHFHLYQPITGVHVDVHWRISPVIYSFNLDGEGLIERSVPRKLHGKEVRTVSDEDTLLILCEHGIRHYWERLIWICDVAIMLKLETMNWPKAIKRASDVGCARALFLGILLASDILGAPFPNGYTRMFDRMDTDKEIRSLADEIVTRLFSDSLDRESANLDESELDAAKELLYLRARERRRDRLSYYIRRISVPTEDDWDSISLPGFLFPAYRLIRPIRLIARYKLGIRKWIQNGLRD